MGNWGYLTLLIGVITYNSIYIYNSYGAHLVDITRRIPSSWGEFLCVLGIFFGGPVIENLSFGVRLDVLCKGCLMFAIWEDDPLSDAHVLETKRKNQGCLMFDLMFENLASKTLKAGTCLFVARSYVSFFSHYIPENKQMSPKKGTNFQ